MVDGIEVARRIARVRRGLLATTVLLASMSAGFGSAAQTAPSAPQAESSSGLETVVVTARKRSESALNAPVILSAVTGAQLKARAINNLDGVARTVPDLVVGNTQSVQGGNITLRGLGASETNPFADQAVAFSIDGVQVARATVQRLALMDLDQVSVYKGPQALFFGKNSPGGVIDIRTADPGQAFETSASVGYEFIGNEVRGDGFVSGELADGLDARLSVYGSDLGGWDKNVTPPNALGPVQRDVPDDKEAAGRLTLKYQPTERLDVKFKLSYDHLDTAGPNENQQLISCPLGSPQTGGSDDCTANDTVVRANPGPGFDVVNPRYGDGAPFLRENQILASAEANYQLSPALTLTSTSGMYSVGVTYLDNFTNASTAPLLLASYQVLNDTELSEEARVASHFEGPLNFVFGGYYQYGRAYTDFEDSYDADAPKTLFYEEAVQIDNAYSAFAQGIWDITPELQLTAGGRYSHEVKSFDVFNHYVAMPTIVPKASFPDFSPEATIRWKPTENMTLFASYKRGFLSGGFNAGAGNLAANRLYGEETSFGYEGGIKGSWFGGDLQTTLSAYDYVLRGLQVVTQTGVNLNVSNAGRSVIRGIELDADWASPIKGLTFSGAASFNRARYTNNTVSCYTGQTVALGCDLDPQRIGRLPGAGFDRTAARART